MPQLDVGHRGSRLTSRQSLGARIGRFLMHFVEMCVVMCVGAFGLSVLFFGIAALLGYTDLPDRAPVLGLFVIAVNLSLPMAVWMRYPGMAWEPTLEMSGATMAAGLLLIAGYLAGGLPRDGLLPLQTGPLVCPLSWQ